MALCAVNGSYHYFLIPVEELGGQRNIAVWSYHPQDYTGQWMKYLEAWGYVAKTVEAVKSRRAYQLPLFF